MSDSSNPQGPPEGAEARCAVCGARPESERHMVHAPNAEIRMQAHPYVSPVQALPCPFCGSPVTARFGDPDNASGLVLHPSVVGCPLTNAVKPFPGWNRRAAPPGVTPEMVEALVDAADTHYVEYICRTDQGRRYWMAWCRRCGELDRVIYCRETTSIDTDDMRDSARAHLRATLEAALGAAPRGVADLSHTIHFADGMDDEESPATRPVQGVTPARDMLGRVVREAWVRWARTQPNPKPTWLVPYDDLAEPDKEADRQIGEAVAAALGAAGPVQGVTPEMVDAVRSAVITWDAEYRMDGWTRLCDLIVERFAALGAAPPTQPELARLTEAESSEAHAMLNRLQDMGDPYALVRTIERFRLRRGPQ